MKKQILPLILGVMVLTALPVRAEEAGVEEAWNALLKAKSETSESTPAENTSPTAAVTEVQTAPPLDGIINDYYPSGALRRERNFVKGQLHGVSKTYYPDGTLQALVNFNYNQLHGVQFNYHANGKLASEVNFDQGVRQGISKTYYESEEPRDEVNYEKGLINGLALRFYDNGQVQQEIRYTLGLREGESKTYFPNGRIYLEESYEKDRLKRRRMYNPAGRLVLDQNPSRQPS